MSYEIVRSYDHKHVRCQHYDIAGIKRLPELKAFLPVIKTMLRGETVIYKTVLKYQLSIERVA
jgi:hypothetical protein